MSNGYVAAFVAVLVGIATAFVMNRLLGAYSPIVREPIAQGVPFFVAWLSVWPWMQRQPGFTAPQGGLVGMVQRAGFIGYAIWIAVGIVAITAARLYF